MLWMLNETYLHVTFGLWATDGQLWPKGTEMRETRKERRGKTSEVGSARVLFWQEAFVGSACGCGSGRRGPV